MFSGHASLVAPTYARVPPFGDRTIRSATQSKSTAADAQLFAIQSAVDSPVGIDASSGAVMIAFPKESWDREP